MTKREIAGINKHWETKTKSAGNQINK